MSRGWSLSSSSWLRQKRLRPRFRLRTRNRLRISTRLRTRLRRRLRTWTWLRRTLWPRWTFWCGLYFWCNDFWTGGNFTNFHFVLCWHTFHFWSSNGLYNFLVDFRIFFLASKQLMLFVTFSFMIAFSFNQISRVFDFGEWPLPQFIHFVGFLPWLVWWACPSAPQF